MKKISKKSFKKVLAFIGGTAFIALCVYNVNLGLSDYGKRSTSLFTLEALADGEGGSSESSTFVFCSQKNKPNDLICDYSNNSNNWGECLESCRPLAFECVISSTLDCNGTFTCPGY